MARKPAAVERKVNNLIDRYKWEFLRRNREYRKDYEALMREFGPWFRKNGYWYDKRRKYTPRAWEFFVETIAPRLKEICVRYQISDPFSPDWSFDNAGYHRIYDFALPIPTDCSDGKAGAVWDLLKHSTNPARGLKPSAQRMRRQAKAKRFSRSKHNFTLQLDLRRRLALLLREANQEIRRRKRLHDALHRTTPTVRHRLDRYPDYLRVWDLRAQGKTFAEIGEIIFPGQSTAATQRAFDNFRAAKKLIERGYKKL